MTSQDIVNSALRILGALDPAETPSVSESTDALARLNDMLDSWSTERLNVVSIASASYPLTSLTQSYLIGTGQTFNAPRPAKIESANVLFTSLSGGVYRFPLELIDAKKWAGIEFKTVSSAQPLMLYYDRAFPFGTLSFFPIPAFTTPTRSVELYTWQVLSQFPDLVTDVPLPPAYSRALRYNLAVEIAAEWASADANVQRAASIATESKAALRMLYGASEADEPQTGPINAIPQG